MGTFNTKIKIYEDGSENRYYCSDFCFGKNTNDDKDVSDATIEERITCYDEQGRELPHMQPHDGNYCRLDFEDKLAEEKSAYYDRKKERSDRRSDMLKRAKDRVYDIVMQNDFSYFLTLTIDPNEFDSTDRIEVMKRMSRWLSNMHSRHGLEYLLVPEYHKSGRIHAHALINDTLTLVDTDRRIFNGKAYKVQTLRANGVCTDNLKPVYNIKEWKYGFTTAIPLDGERIKIAHYVTKYIVKDMHRIFGKYYWSSQALRRDVDTVLQNTVFNDVNKPVYVARNGYKFKYDMQPISHIANENGKQIVRELQGMPDIDYANIPWED